MAEDVKGWAALMAKLAALTGEELEAVSDKAAQDCAAANAKASKALVTPDSGELRSSIHFAIEKRRGGNVAICYTNSDHAAFVEFGTGPVGAEAGGNGSPVKVDYSLGPFRIRRGNFAGGVNEVYADYWVYRDHNGRFWATRGQPARPFMYPGAMAVKRQVKSIQAATLKKFLKALGK